MARLSENDRWAVGLIWLAIAGFGADWPGLHTMVGAFLAGVMLDAKWFGVAALLLAAVGSTMLTTPIAAPLLKRLGDRVKEEV